MRNMTQLAADKQFLQAIVDNNNHIPDDIDYFLFLKALLQNFASTDPQLRDNLTYRQQWEEFYTTAEVFHALLQVGKYSHVDLDFIDGRFVPKPRGWTSGPDEFELEIGNTLVYAVPLWKRGDYYDSLKAQWLPYYSEALRQERLTMVRRYCVNNLDHIPLYIRRELYFQSFNRLYDAFREFLQALFISRRIYPISYDKWIREQVEEVLDLPDLYQRLPRLFEISHFESNEIARKAEELQGMLEEYVK